MSWQTQVRGPVGLDLGGETPSEIALEILAEIMQVRKQGGAPAGAPPERTVLAER